MQWFPHLTSFYGKERKIRLRKGIRISVEISMYSVASAFMDKVLMKHKCRSEDLPAGDITLYKYIPFPFIARLMVLCTLCSLRVIEVAVVLASSSLRMF